MIVIGQILSHYRVAEKLGAGGMGIVYRAEDLRLQRHVAIKLLPPDVTGDADTKRRFMVEAQAASALDHPNICTIHEIDETPDGQLFLVMAYYEGETLQTKIQRGPLKVDEALDHAVQIAQGLVKAHGTGIVHRDIKPANTFITSDGLVKLLDFGIARLHGQAGVTRTGMTLGTPAYMSPEQMLGSGVDARSDLWSLGVLLYEMLSGQLPFRGDHPTAIAHAIAHATPAPLTTLRSGIPIELDRITGRALAKNPADRYQTAADFLSELRRLKRESDSHQATAGTPVVSQKTHGKAWLTYWALGAAAILAAGAYATLQWRSREPPIPTLTNPVQIAGTVAIEGRPAWSPDGQMIAYASDQGGKQDIWIAQVGGGPAINRTAAFEGDHHQPRWSPDGRQLLFSSIRNGSVFNFSVMPALAGGARNVAPMLPNSSADWSPDGSQIIYPRGGGDQRWMEILDLRTMATRRLQGIGSRFDLSWSPDGRFVALVDAANADYSSSVTQLAIMDVRDGTVRQITEGRTADWTPSWTPDSRALYFTSNRGGTRDLWRQHLSADGTPAGAAQQISAGLDALQAAISPDGRRVVYAKGRRVAHLYRVPLHAVRAATWTDARQLTFDYADIGMIDLSLDGSQLAIQSDRSGNYDIWTLPAAGGEMQLIVADPAPDMAPAWSRDGRTLAFYGLRTGYREVWVQPVAGGPARQLTFSGGSHPAWSRDGTTVFVNHWTRPGPGGVPSKGLGLIAVPAAGGEPRLVAPVGVARMSVAPDGGWLASSGTVGSQSGIFRVPVAGGPPQLVTTQGSFPQWSPDGRSILYTHGGEVWRVALDGKDERPLTNLKGRRGSLVHFDADDRSIYFAWREDVSDIWVMDFDRGSRR